MFARITALTSNRLGSQLRTAVNRSQQIFAQQRQLRQQRRLLADLRNSVPPHLHQDIGLTDVRQVSDIEPLSQRLRR